MSESKIQPAESAADVRRCFPVMQELRPHLTEAGFVERVRRQLQQGYRLVFLEREGEVIACAGYRYLENLAWGRFLYVDDLICRSDRRSQGAGKALFHWLLAQARAEGCEELHLDSGVQRFDAHRFYLRERMHITSHHFALKLAPNPSPEAETRSAW